MCALVGKIERIRAQLGDTVEALAHKADVPARVKDKVHHTEEAVQLKAEEVTQHVLDATAPSKPRQLRWGSRRAWNLK